MPSQKRAGVPPALRWTCFLVVLAVAIGWAAKSVLARAARMRIADTSAQAFSTATAGTHLEAVVRIDQVAGKDLKCTLLEKVNETTCRRLRSGGAAVSAELTPETPVVMGKAQDIVVGAIVQLVGTLGADHVLEVSRAVVLTGYVHLDDDPKPMP